MTDTIGVDVGGTLIKVLRLLPGGRIETSLTVPLPQSPEEVIAAVEAAVNQLRTEQTSAVGVGMAGLVRWPEGVFVWGPHLPWLDLPIGEKLRASLELPVLVDNDANCAALAEVRQGAATGARHAVLVAIGTGIGGGLVVEGEVYRGSSFAGELGHITLVPGGEQCACGRRGCWETLVSNSKLEPWLEGGRAGEEQALAELEAIGRWLGRGLAVVMMVADPDVIVVGGGGTAAAGEFLLPAARRELGIALEGAEHRPPIDLRPAAAGAWAGALGAGMLATTVLSQEHPPS
jgi:glucokinase